MNYLPHCNATYISPFNLLKTCESSANDLGFFVSSSAASGVSGSNVIGYYTDSSGFQSGFLYNGSVYTTLKDPMSYGSTTPYGISGNTIVGLYSTPGGLGSFIYDGSKYTPLSNPSAATTLAFGICGSNIVGTYLDAPSNTYHGFLYDGSTWKTLDDPLGTTTVLRGISGGDIVGYYYTDAGISHGCLYDGSTWTTLDDPLGDETLAIGISGNCVVGWYRDPSNQDHGFAVTVPEANTLTLFGVGAVGFAACMWRRRAIEGSATVTARSSPCN